MKIKFSSLLVLIALWTAIAPARAALVAEDDFAYADGPLPGQNGGTGWTTAWNGFSMNVVAGWAMPVVGNPQEQAANRIFDNPGSTPEMFVAFDLRTPASWASNDYAALGLQEGVNLQNIALGKWPGGDELLVANGGSATTGIAIQPNTIYHLIGSYDLDNHVISLWVNPDASDYYDPTTAATSADAFVGDLGYGHMSRLVFVTNKLGGFAFDNIVLGDTPEDVGLLSSAPVDCDCPGDVNGDTHKDGLDVQAFTDCLFIGGRCACADLDGLNGVDLVDAALFAEALLGDGSCP